MNDVYLFKAMFIFMFFGYLRIGKVTASVNNLQFHHVVLSNHILITFHKFKLHIGLPFKLSIAPKPFLCPVVNLKQFIRVRGPQAGALFVLKSNLPVPSQYFYSVFYKLSLCGLDPNFIKPHSFRIGAATHAFNKGVTLQNIQKMGRWKSDTFIKYIRIN